MFMFWVFLVLKNIHILSCELFVVVDVSYCSVLAAKVQKSANHGIICSTLVPRSSQAYFCALLPLLQMT